MLISNDIYDFSKKHLFVLNLYNWEINWGNKIDNKEIQSDFK